MYCLKCRKKTADKDVSFKYSKNGRKMMVAKCSVCGIMKHQFTSGQKGGNPLAIAGIQAVGSAAPGAISAIGNLINEGTKQRGDWMKHIGADKIDKIKSFTDFFRELQHIRYWQPTSLPKSLRLSSFGIGDNDSETGMWFRASPAQRTNADNKLQKWAWKQYYGTESDD